MDVIFMNGKMLTRIFSILLLNYILSYALKLTKNNDDHFGTPITR